MRNLVSVILVGLAISGSAFAITTNLDANAIKHIHGQIVISFSANCKKTLSGSSDAICTCLAGKANDYLDDDALSQCANDDTGITCVSKLVASASTKALSKDNVAICVQQATISSQDTNANMNPSVSSEDTAGAETNAASTPSTTLAKQAKNSVKTENIGSTVDENDTNDGSY